MRASASKSVHISLPPRTNAHSASHTHTRARECIHPIPASQMVPPNAKHRVQMPPVVACPRCRANIQLPPGAPIVACPVCHTCIQMTFAPPPPVMQTGPSLQPGPSFTHTPVANSSGDMATTRATPTTRATGCLQGFDRPAGWRFDHTGGFHLQRPAPKPTQLPPRPHRRRASIGEALDGRDGQGLRAAAWKVPPRGGPKAGTKWDARDASTGKVLLEWNIAEWTPIGPAADPRPAPVVQRTIVGSWRSPLRLLTPSEWDTDMDHWDEPVDDNAGPDFDCCPTTTPYHERVMYYTCLRHTLFFCFFIRSSDFLSRRNCASCRCSRLCSGCGEPPSSSYQTFVGILIVQAVVGGHCLHGHQRFVCPGSVVGPSVVRLASSASSLFSSLPCGPRYYW